jgi:hypothetical protein
MLFLYAMDQKKSKRRGTKVATASSTEWGVSKFINKIKREKRKHYGQKRWYMRRGTLGIFRLPSNVPGPYNRGDRRDVQGPKGI